MIGFRKYKMLSAGPEPDPFPQDYITLTFASFDALAFDINDPAAWNQELSAHGSNTDFTNVLVDGLTVKLAGNLNVPTNFSATYLEITSVELSKLESLEILSLEGNLLAEIDFIQIYKDQLTSVNLNYNFLINIDLSILLTAPLLYLSLDGNQLQNIELTGLTKLEQLLCSYNELTTVHFEGNEALVYVALTNNKLLEIQLSPCPILEELHCSHNSQLSDLGIVQNYNLKVLYATHCNFVGSFSLSSCRNITTLALHHNHISELTELNELTDINLVGFLLNNNDLTYDFIESLIFYLLLGAYTPPYIYMNFGNNAAIQGLPAEPKYWQLRNAYGVDIRCNPFY